MPTNKTEALDIPPLVQRPGEPSRWFERLHHFALLDPAKRSLLRAYREEIQRERAGKSGIIPKTVPASWVAASRKWEWAARVQAADDARRAREDADLDTFRRKAQKYRARLLASFAKRIREGILLLNPMNASFAQLAAALRALGMESREELELSQLRELVETIEKERPSEATINDAFARRMRARAEKRHPGGANESDCA